MSVTETMGGPVAEQMACMQSGEIFIPSQREEGFLYQTVRGHVEVDGRFLRLQENDATDWPGNR
jgi:hypothetical protein